MLDQEDWDKRDLRHYQAAFQHATTRLDARQFARVDPDDLDELQRLRVEVIVIVSVVSGFLLPTLVRVMLSEPSLNRSLAILKS